MLLSKIETKSPKSCDCRSSQILYYCSNETDLLVYSFFMDCVCVNVLNFSERRLSKPQVVRICFANLYALRLSLQWHTAARHFSTFTVLHSLLKMV